MPCISKRIGKPSTSSTRGCMCRQEEAGTQKKASPFREHPSITGRGKPAGDKQSTDFCLFFLNDSIPKARSLWAALLLGSSQGAGSTFACVLHCCCCCSPLMWSGDCTLPQRNNLMCRALEIGRKFDTSRPLIPQVGYRRSSSRRHQNQVKSNRIAVHQGCIA